VLQNSKFDGADFSNGIIDRVSFDGSSMKGAIFTVSCHVVTTFQECCNIYMALKKPSLISQLAHSIDSYISKKYYSAHTAHRLHHISQLITMSWLYLLLFPTRVQNAVLTSTSSVGADVENAVSLQVTDGYIRMLHHHCTGSSIMVVLVRKGSKVHMFLFQEV
jgi:uncharacterized protein YjbI with pentapeptide repeats